jgi:hypothetical protein
MEKKMTSPLLIHIKKSQKEYLEMISQYKSLFEQEEVPLKEINFMLDDMNCFWLERLEAIEFELKELAEKNSCFLLSGAIYLNVSDNEHYYFKLLGDYQLLPDPFLRMESFFRIPEDIANAKETSDYLKEVFSDTLEMLTKYENQFFILPTRLIAIKDEIKHQETLNIFFLRFVASILNKPFSSAEEFYNNYKSFEEIENGMDSYVRDRLKFNNSDETGLSLREKIERYCKTQMNFKNLIKDKSESQIFWISTYTWVSQIIDLLLVCVKLNVYPYIRFNVTFYYLSLLMYTFIEDKNLKEIIEKSIVFYILRKTIEEKKFENIEFNDFCKLIANKSLLNVIIDEMRKLGIDICHGGIKQVQSIITKEFDKIISVSQK